MNAVMTHAELKHASLYYREGGSDKLYQVAIEPAGERFTVNFAYGRRGTTLNTGTKTNVPVEYDKALNIFEKLVKEKKSKGYTEGEDGSRYQHSEKQVSGFTPQLLNPIEEAHLEHYIQDTGYCAQEKFDGKRILLQKSGASINGINRKGLMCGLPSAVVYSAQRLPSDCVLDGECVGDNLHVFDILMLGTEDLRPLGYKVRYLSLMNLLAATPSHHQKAIHLADSFGTTKEKAALLKHLREQKREGIVFKKLDAPYTPGRPNSGGPQLKHKFYATASAVVSRINDKRSVEVRLLNCEGWVPAGNVTIPVNFNVPKVGQVVEIRYLYAFKESGALYQPTFLGARDDVAVMDCKTTQLKYKAEEEV